MSHSLPATILLLPRPRVSGGIIATWAHIGCLKANRARSWKRDVAREEEREGGRDGWSGARVSEARAMSSPLLPSLMREEAYVGVGGGFGGTKHQPTNQLLMSFTCDTVKQSAQSSKNSTKASTSKKTSYVVHLGYCNNRQSSVISANAPTLEKNILTFYIFNSASWVFQLEQELRGC